LPLLRLREANARRPAGPARAAIEQALTSGSCSGSATTLPNTLDTPHFHLEYGAIGGGLTIADYEAALETAWATEVDSFGWAAPPVYAANPAPGGRHPVRVEALGNGLYGFTSNSGTYAGFVGDNPNTTWDEGDAYASCIVLHNDYGGYRAPGLPSLQPTAAHELNHALQYGYGALTGPNCPDAVFVEGCATWMEDEVFTASNDNYNYLWPTFSMCMGAYSSSPYGYWITWRGLSERYGTGVAGGAEQVMQDFWELTSRSGSSNMLDALDAALGNKGTNLADAYHAYAIAVKFNKTCGGGYVYPYCLKEGDAYIQGYADKGYSIGGQGATPLNGTVTSVTGAFSGSVPDNYALNWIALPPTGAYTVTLTNTASGGQLRGSVVCDTGATLVVRPLPVVASAGVSTALAGTDPAGCASVVAVLTNQARTAANPGTCTPASYTLRLSGQVSGPTATATPTASASPTATPPTASSPLGARIFMAQVLR
jgi:hypothetical protein